MGLLRKRTGRHWSVVVMVAVTVLVAGWWGSGLDDRDLTEGSVPVGAESAQAAEVLAGQFRAGRPDIVLLARTRTALDRPDVVAAGTRLARRLHVDPSVGRVVSYWPVPRPSLRSHDGRGVVVLGWLRREVRDDMGEAGAVTARLTGREGPLMVSAAGDAVVRDAVAAQAGRDAERGELLALPVTACLLLLVFRSAVAATLPIVAGVFSVLGTRAVLRVLTQVSEVSVYAVNISAALAFGLTLDYSLFLISRYREERDRQAAPDVAVSRTLRTSGRAVAFSAATVALAMAALLVFPHPLLRSVAMGGLAVTVTALAGSLVLLPALLILLGDRLDRLDVLAPFRRGKAGPGREEVGWWGRVAAVTTRRPLWVALPAVALLSVLAAPFTDVRFALSDHRVLPADAPAARATEAFLHGYPVAADGAAISVVLPGLRPGSGRDQALDGYARRVSAVAGVRRVQAATGVYRDGLRRASAGPAAARLVSARGTYLVVDGTGGRGRPAGVEVVRRIRAVPSPAPVLVGGVDARLADVQGAMAARAPWALGLSAGALFCLVLALTRRPVLALKALALNALSLCAMFGAIVFVFQEGHLRRLVGDFTVTGTTDVLLPVLVFCIAFGVSMDYEVILLSRIVEEHHRTGESLRAVVRGVDRTASLFTWAAVILTVVMCALAASELVFLKLIGVGLALAALVDATLVRGLLVPALMALFGRANWWAPAWLLPAPSRTAHAGGHGEREACGARSGPSLATEGESRASR
ncbi:membrane protein [Streptomyces fumigatiscleroticus]|nr:membrane protein [Streptomyces fumigatiscleroticus]